MKILIGIPSYDGRVQGRLLGIVPAAAMAVPIIVSRKDSSLLFANFNRTLCDAINDESITHYCLLHEDIVPSNGGWLKTLLHEHHTHRADVLSAVVPLKIKEDMTSTGVDAGFIDPLKPFNVRRLTLAETKTLPQTFTAKDTIKIVGPEYTGRALCINTGLMVMSNIFARKIVNQGFCFTINDRIFKHADGTYQATVEAEDWGMSRWLHTNGYKAMATSAIPLTHHGRGEWNNE